MVRAVSSVMLLRILGIGFQLGWFMLLVRLLPQEQVGIYSAINAFWLLMRALGPLGSDQALMRQIPSLLEQGDRPRARLWQRLALHYLLRWQGLLLLLGFVLALVAQALGLWEMPAWMLVMIALVALFYGINGQQVYVMLAAGRPMLANGWESLWLPLALALASVALHLAGALSLANLLCSQGVIMLGFCLFGLWLVRRMLQGETQELPQLSPPERAEFAHQSRSLFATSAVIHLNMRLPVVIAPLMIGAAQTAILETAIRFATLLGLVSFAAAQVVLPKISAYARQQKRSELQQLLHESSWLIFLPTLLLYGALALLGKWMLSLLAGEAYMDAYAPMLVLGAAYVLAAAAGPMQHVYTMSGLAHLVSKVSLLEMLMSLFLIWLLAPVLGAMGMAAALCFGMVLRNGLFHGMLPAKLKLQPGVLSSQGVRWLASRVWP